MDLQKVLFLGGRPARGSVQIRCVQIARHLRCDYQLDWPVPEAVLERYAVLVCVKPRLHEDDLALLAQRGTVVWDILDAPPPRENIAVYLASSPFAAQIFAEYGRVEMIPHHHCNGTGAFNPEGNRRPAWVGCRQWYPPLPGVEHDAYFSDRMKPEELVKAYRKTGIGMNLRKQGKLREFHVAINSGIKLINCLGFGIPSVSSDEPAYHEFGGDCTLFAEPENCAEAVAALQNDDNLYRELRANCLRRAAEFHIEAIAQKYRALFATL